MNFEYIISILLCVVVSPDSIEGFACAPFPLVSSYFSFQIEKSSSTKSLYTTAAAGVTSSLDGGLSNDTNNDNYIDPTSRFHNDMRRVLESRKDAFDESSSTKNDRRNRPALLNQDIDGANRVTSMLRHMVNIGVATELTYQIVFEALCKRGRLRWAGSDTIIVCAADVVEDLYDEVWDYLNGSPSTTTCNLVLQIYAACSTPRGNRQYAQKAQALLDEMEDEGIDPSIETFKHVVNAWAWQQGNHGDKECVEKAENNLEKLLGISPDDETRLQAYHFVLEAWSKVREQDAPTNADRILHEMKLIRKSSTSLTSNLPNNESYTNAILAWTKSNSSAKAHELLYEYIDKFEKYVDNLEEGDNISVDMEPELFAFNGVISAWARVGRTDKAEEVLWKADEIRTKCKTFVPDVYSYNSILHAYTKDKKDGSNSLQKILQIVDFMDKNKKEQPTIYPDCFTYHCVLRAWTSSKNEDSSIKAVQALEKMHNLWESGDKSLDPASAYYNMAINKIAKSKGGVNPRKALDILNLLKLSQFCDPDIISYTTVIECLSKSYDDPTTAEQSLDLFYEAWSIYQEKEDPGMMPNVRTYTMVILSLSKNPTFGNIMKARDLLTQLNDLYNKSKDSQLRPNAYPYNYVLNSAASCVGSSGEKLKAFQIAAQTYNDLRNSGLSPDSFTYAFWFKLCNNLLPEGEVRRKSISYSFEQCKKDGMLSKNVLNRLLSGTPPDILATLLKIKPGTSPATYRKMRLDDFPPSWSRNVR